jgi:hypothetical protein
MVGAGSLGSSAQMHPVIIDGGEMSFTPVLIAAFLVAIQGVLLQTSCTLTGQKPPPYGAALLTSLIGGILTGIGTFLFAWTFALVIGLFSSTLAWIATWSVGIAITASVYRTRLDLATPRAIAVSIAHHFLAGTIATVLWFVLRYWPF